MSLAQTCHSFTLGADLRGRTPGLGLLFGLPLARLPENVVVTACSGVVGLGVPRLLGATFGLCLEAAAGEGLGFFAATFGLCLEAAAGEGLGFFATTLGLIGVFGCGLRTTGLGLRTTGFLGLRTTGFLGLALGLA